jgi:hypothetical protein
MSNYEYEDAYREARLLTSELGYSIGIPFQMPAGRVCEVDGICCDDYRIFELAWGKEVADQIQMEVGRSSQSTVH